MLLVTFEERDRELEAVEYLCRSLACYEPEVPFVMAAPSRHVERLESFVDLHPLASVRDMGDRRWGYTVKPRLLLDLLDAQPQRPLVWIDSDIVACRPFARELTRHGEATLIATTEYAAARYSGSEIRCEKLGYQEKRRFPRSINSSIVLVTDAHRPLLEAWERRMLEEDYQTNAAMPMTQRPPWLAGDQCVLTLLLASEFAQVPVHLLRSGLDIAHELPGAGYSLTERLSNLAHRRLPFFAHAIGDGKPWRMGASQSVNRFKRSMIELSLYNHVVRQILPPAQWPGWARTSTPDARAASWASLSHPTVKGLPHSLAYSAARLGFHLLKGRPTDPGAGTSG